jgi:hypothetical protein
VLDVRSAPVASARETKARVVVEERAQTTSFALTVLEVRECQAKGFAPPKPGNVRLGVEVQFEGLAEHEVPVNPYYARVADAAGTVYSTTFGGCEPALNVVRLARGEVAKGYINFELPAKAKGLVMTYDPVTFGDKQDVSVALGR